MMKYFSFIYVFILSLQLFYVKNFQPYGFFLFFGSLNVIIILDLIISKKEERLVSLNKVLFFFGDCCAWFLFACAYLLFFELGDFLGTEVSFLIKLFQVPWFPFLTKHTSAKQKSKPRRTCLFMKQNRPQLKVNESSLRTLQSK